VGLPASGRPPDAWRIPSRSTRPAPADRRLARGSAGPISDRLYTRALSALGRAQSRWLETPLGPIHALEMPGRGRLGTAVLIHGFSSAGAHLLGIARRLQADFGRVIAPDLPGHGLSPAHLPHTDVGVHDLARRALDAALDAWVSEPATVFGSSLGGLVAIRLALWRPDRVRALVVASPGGAPMTDDELDAFRRRFVLDSHRDALRFVDRVLDTSTPMRHAMAWGVRRRFNRPHLQEVLARARPELMLRPEALAALAPPTLCLWGERDRVFPDSARRFFASNLPAHARFEHLAGLGHGPYLERPDVVARRIVSFAEVLEG